MTNGTDRDGPVDADKLLAIYLRDHLAGSTAGLALVGRCRRSNEGSALGAVLAELETEIESDREVLRSIMVRLSVSESQVKKVVGRVAEIAARVKTNGRIARYSPLSRVVELEGLITGVSGKRALWTSLLEVAPTRPELEPDVLQSLVDRATSQHARLLVEHDRAAAVAFWR